MKKEVIIIGAGPAGLGVASVLQRMGVHDFIILEQNEIGASFKKWPKEMRFISPSFTGNNFKMPDLNAITPDTSPAYSLQTEHPTGVEYAAYLEAIAEIYELPVETNQTVIEIQKSEGEWTIHTKTDTFIAKYVIWAAGEFHYPKTQDITGSEHCIHNSQVESWSKLEGDKYVVIGGYESGIDAAIHLSRSGKMVAVLDNEEPWNETHSDSSYSVSPYTRDRLTEEIRNGRIALEGNTSVSAIRKEDDSYIVEYGDKTVIVEQKPILANGFATSLQLVKEHFSFAADGYPELTEDDESTLAINLFLVGPQVKHDEALFCFIYKYRQRFAVVAETIANRLDIAQEKVQEVIEDYTLYNFYLRDLSCCSTSCVC